jgi:hypothetical protein
MFREQTTCYYDAIVNQIEAFDAKELDRQALVTLAKAQDSLSRARAALRESRPSTPPMSDER